MDTFDTPRSSVPARMASQRPIVPVTIRNSGGLPEVATASPLSVRVAVRGVRRYWWLVLMLWVVGSAGVCAAVYKLVKPKYKAVSLIQVSEMADDLYGVRGNNEQLTTFLNTQVQLIKSPGVLQAAAASPKAAVLPKIQMATDVVIELSTDITARVVPTTSLIEVSMTSGEAFEAAILVNAVVNAFMNSNKLLANADKTTQIEALQEYKKGLEEKSAAIEAKWRSLVGKGNADPQVVIRDQVNEESARGEGDNPQRTITLDIFREVQHELFVVSMDLAEATAQMEAMKAAIENARNAPTPTPEVDEGLIAEQVEARFRDDRDVIALAHQMMEAREKRDQIGRTTRMPGDPAERKAHENLKRLEARYERLWELKSRQIREEILAAVGGKRPFESAESDLRAAISKVDLLKIKQQTLQTQFDRLEVKNKDQAADTVSIAMVLEERASLRAMQEAVNRRIEQFTFESKGEARISVVDEAQPPGKPFSNNQKKFMAITPVGILGAVLGLVVLLEVRSARVADPDVLSTKIRQEVFAIAPLPDLRAGEDGNDEKSEQRLARFVQSLDHLRVALCEGGLSGEGRCVMITSATGGEGKTTLAAHLAARCANARTSTLLIDADMRRASLGRLLDVPPGPGLADVLAGDVAFEDATITVQAGGFHFLSAGITGRDPSRVLKSTRLSELLGRLRQQYDLVIIDTPPILPVADALIIGRWADGAVMAARFDASRMPLVERANRQLATAGIPVLGVVVNGVKGQHAAYGNYAYSYNYNGPADRSTPAVTS
ncbi:polysaccharide biosynthesis tyrosine autokinase (plasmid) [Tundrisphaera lichenicola]|uniref:polysaccharide biosynthesis tyrosine autokinase n=1 Tax=Tundrisphaera lichenicola TaxID=2029860 RepID=UPI003EBD14B2